MQHRRLRMGGRRVSRGGYPQVRFWLGSAVAAARAASMSPRQLLHVLHLPVHLVRLRAGDADVGEGKEVGGDDACALLGVEILGRELGLKDAHKLAAGHLLLDLLEVLEVFASILGFLKAQKFAGPAGRKARRTSELDDE